MKWLFLDCSTTAAISLVVGLLPVVCSPVWAGFREAFPRLNLAPSCLPTEGPFGIGVMISIAAESGSSFHYASS